MAMLTPSFPPLRLPALRPAGAALLLAAALAGGAALIAQVSGERGITPVAATTDIEVRGIQVNTTGETAEEARRAGWAEAQRLAWAKIGGPKLPDSQLDGLVTAIIVGPEQLGPRRYIATLGVVFDRTRAGGLLGGGGARSRSAPMLVLPILVTGGTQTVFEVRNPWQRAWAEYQAGQSRIDYVRPAGAGGDSLLLTYGQIGRRSRTWWRNVLDQFGASDVLMAIADLDYEYPGGPVQGTFTARYGPDAEFLDTFTMSAPSQDALPEMLDKAVLRFNAIYEAALDSGKLKPDPTLNLGTPQIDPALQRLIEYGRAVEAQERARQARDVPSATPSEAPAADPAPAVVSSYAVQFATPDASAFDATLSAVRGTPGVRGAAATSTAIGGTSVMTVSFAGDLDALAGALRARGLTVRQAGAGLAISR